MCICYLLQLLISYVINIVLKVTTSSTMFPVTILYTLLMPIHIMPTSPSCFDTVYTVHHISQHIIFTNS